MDKHQFIQWLRNEYRPPVETGENGGYLIPHYITADKSGWWAWFCRGIGRLFRSQRIYKAGTYQLDMHAALTAMVKKEQIKRKEL